MYAYKYINIDAENKCQEMVFTLVCVVISYDFLLHSFSLH